MDLKETIIQYVGDKLKPEDNEVTVTMVVETLMEEFPDMMLMVAQENFLRGYEQALDDVEAVESGRLKLSTEEESEAS